MAVDNPAYIPDPKINIGIYVINKFSDEYTFEDKREVPQSPANEETKRMGWYRQAGKQWGLRQTALEQAATSLLLVFPCLLLPSLLGPSAPRALQIPPLAWLFSRLLQALRLPPVPGMVAVGLLFRALGWYELSPIWLRVIYLTRYVSIAVVLLKGGLAMSSLPSLPLLLLPCTIEASAIALLSNHCLGVSYQWGFVFGFSVSAASSSVNAEKLSELKGGGFGSKELYELLLPSSTVENIYSITAFTLTLVLTLTGKADWWTYALKGPLAVLAGVIFALSWGFLCAVFPHKDDSLVVWKRSAMVLLGTQMVYLGAKAYGLAPGGPLGSVLIGVTASFFWASQGWQQGKNPVSEVVAISWSLLEACLFGFAGAEVDVMSISLEDLSVVGIIVGVSLVIRIAVFLITVAVRRKFTMGEMILGALVWFPKATVLAALSPQVLDNLRILEASDGREMGQHELKMAGLIMFASVVEMFITMPISYLSVNIFSERLLRKQAPDEKGDYSSVAVKI